MNNSAQIHVLEVIFVAVMFFIALYFVRSMDVSTYATVEKENRLEKLGNDILADLAGQANSSGEYEYSSLLAYYISDPLDSNRANDLRSYVDAVLPEGTLHKILRINLSETMCNATATIKSCTDVLDAPVMWVGEDARVSRIVVVHGFVYEVVLCMWNNLGE